MEFRILGPLEVHDGAENLDVGTPRTRALLAVLLITPGRLVGVDRLVDELWPEEPPADARALVHSYVSRVRRVLRRGQAAERLVTRKPGYLLRVEEQELDLHCYQQLVAEARAARRGGRVQDCVSLLRRAERLWRGPPLADVPSTPATAAAATRLTELRLTTLEELYDAALDSGAPGESLVADLTEVVAAHPLRERFVGQLMLALHRVGRTADALAAYQELRRRLADELGLDPGPSLRELELTILRDEPEPAATPVPGPAQLPADLPAFTGRTAELNDLLATGRPAETVVISAIDGMAGIGKTALAIRAAHRLAPRFPDGQLFIDLHGHTQGMDPVDPSDALDQLLRALGVRGDNIPSQLDARAALYRSRIAGRRMLIALDNAISEAQVLPLLPGTPGCQVLVTSRRRLSGLDHARPLTLGTLPAADAAALFTGLIGDPSVDPGLVDEIVELCGRLPLAIRLAAARLRTRHGWTPAHLAGRLRDQQRRVTELRAGERSVAAAFQLSYTHLDPDQRRLFRLLGLHPGPDIDTAAAAALAGLGVEHVERLLDDLLDAHMVEQHQPDRYQFHDLIRAHAGQVATEEPEPDRRDALARLRDHYACAASAAVDLVYPNDIDRRPRVTGPVVAFDTPARATAWLDGELANVLATATDPADPAHTVRMSAILYRYLRSRGRHSDAKTLHAQALRAAYGTGDRVGELRALVHLGWTRHRQGDRDAAAGYFDRALAASEETGHRAGEVDALVGLGHVGFSLGRLDRTIGHFQSALKIARESGDRFGETYASLGLGHVYYTQGQTQQSADCYRQALAFARDAGDQYGEADALAGLGHLHQIQGQLEPASDRLTESLALTRSTGSQILELNVLRALGHVHRLRDRHGAAVDCFQEVLDIARASGDRNSQFEAVLGLGLTRQATGHLDQALDLARTLNQPLDEARAHAALAGAHHDLGHLDDARRHYEHCLAILTDRGATRIEEIDIDDIRARLAGL